MFTFMQGFNNEHPNAKRAAVMKKKDWVRSDAERHCAFTPFTSGITNRLMGRCSVSWLASLQYGMDTAFAALEQRNCVVIQVPCATQHDASGRKGKGYGAYRFTEQYGDINDYSPIYDRTLQPSTHPRLPCPLQRGAASLHDAHRPEIFLAMVS